MYGLGKIRTSFSRLRNNISVYRKGTWRRGWYKVTFHFCESCFEYSVCPVLLSYLRLLSGVTYHVIGDGGQKRRTYRNNSGIYIGRTRVLVCRLSWICYFAGATTDLHVRHFASATCNKHTHDSSYPSKFPPPPPPPLDKGMKPRRRFATWPLNSTIRFIYLAVSA